jgi:hypothetical protein
MRKPKRRRRTPDPLASPQAVRQVLGQLRSRLPEIIPEKEKEIVALLRSALHTETCPAPATHRGRPLRWPRQELPRVASALKAVLGRGTWGQKELRTFVGHYLPLLSFPADVVAALEAGEVSLFEAEQLARLTPLRLGASASAARKQRVRLLRAHLDSREPCGRLRARVSALLDQSAEGGAPRQALPSPEFSPEILEAASGLEAELEAGAILPGAPEWSGEVDPGHIFFEHLRLIAEALREVRPEELTDEVLGRLYASGDEILLILQRARKQRHQPGVCL